MAAKSLKETLKRQELTIGSWLSLGYTPVCEMMARAGFDWLVIDMEHTAISINQAMQLIQVIDLSGCVPLVRVGGNAPLLIKQAMDSGAHGVIVPMINTEDDAKRAVESLYYPPKGRRGAGLYRAQKYGADFDGYKEWADRESVLIVQIEHIDGVSNLERIISVDGVDGFIVGPYDLSGSLGMPGNWNHSMVKDALDEVSRIIKSNIKPGGYHIVHSDHDELLYMIGEGYKIIAYGDDMVFLSEKLRDETDFLRKHIKA